MTPASPRASPSRAVSPTALERGGRGRIVGDIRPLLSRRQLLPRHDTARKSPLPPRGDPARVLGGWSNGNGPGTGGYGQTTARTGGPTTSRREREGERGLLSRGGDTADPGSGSSRAPGSTRCARMR